MMVIDTNVAISILVEDRMIRTDLLENQYIVAPFFMQMEILNVLRKYHFMRNIPMEDVDKIYHDFIDIVDEFIPDEEILESARKISFTLNHPIYDCLFLALAQQKNAPFVSFDRRLLDKADQVGIKIVSI